jgi:hydrogenase maturation protease
VSARVLVAGIGNVFLGDDGFGTAVAERLATRQPPEGVRYADFGIRGVHLVYEMLDGYDGLVLVDAVPLGAPPGTVAVIVPEPPPPPARGHDATPLFDAHSMGPDAVLRMLAGLRCMPDHLRVVACQPSSLDEGIGLSPPVTAALDRAVEAVDDVVTDLLAAIGHSGRKESSA